MKQQNLDIEPCKRHKALSAGRCDGRGTERADRRLSRVTKPCQRAGVMDDDGDRQSHLARHVTKPCQRAGVMDVGTFKVQCLHMSRHKALSAGRCDGRLYRACSLDRGVVTKPCQRAGVMDHTSGFRPSPGPLVTKPCQRAGVMDLVFRPSSNRLPPGHKALSAGRCDGRHTAWTTTTNSSSHKALSAGRCDGHPRCCPYPRYRLVVTKPCQRAGVMDQFQLDHFALGSGRHKALSAGRCDGRHMSPPSSSWTSCHKALSAGRCDGPEYWGSLLTSRLKSQSPVSGQV